MLLYINIKNVVINGKKRKINRNIMCTACAIIRMSWSENTIE